MANVKLLPKEKGLDHSLNVLQEGYDYFLKRREAMESDVFETRILGQKAYSLGGESATALFYDTTKFKREGAMPSPVQKVLTGENGVQSLDGKEHENRKKMFMSLMSKDELGRFSTILKKYWDLYAAKWTTVEQIVLYDEVKEILCRSGCEWAGIPLNEKEIAERTEDLADLFETTASISPAYLHGRHSRKKSEAWMQRLVNQVRNQELKPAENTALYVFSWHRDLEHNLLDEHTAAVELLNIIRPITAISIYLAFSAQALIQFPETASKLTSGEPKQYQNFVQEVRRFYPFFPFQAALTKNDFIWNGYQFEKDTLSILDIYGTNHDPKIWHKPDLFQPERFKEWNESPFSFIPQGGGEHISGHRCAGEWITILVMNICLDYLVNQLRFSVPEQDLSFDMAKFPTIPKSRVILSNIKMR